MLQSNSAAESSNLIAMPTSLRASSMTRTLAGAGLPSLGGPNPWKDLALAGIESANSCKQGRDVSAQAQTKLTAALANMDKRDLKILAQMSQRVQAKAKQIQQQSG